MNGKGYCKVVAFEVGRPDCKGYCKVVTFETGKPGMYFLLLFMLVNIGGRAIRQLSLLSQ
jgi:hypothetical protein